jgi:NhaP-type Na+/H+ or K+/H+ antiporter
VFTCTAGSDLSWKQRAFVAWICPRGIVAAAVAGLFALRLGEAGIAGATRLEALVFVTVAATVTLQGLTAGRVAHWLGVDVPTAIGTMVIGADRLGCLLAQLLVMLGRQVVLIDRSALHCRRARAEHLPVFEGDALSVDTLEEAGARYADTVISLTANAQLNELLATRVRDHFSVERVFALTEGGGDAAESNGRRPFPGHFPGVDEANRLLRLGRLRVVEYEVPRAEKQLRRLDALPYGEGEFALLVLRGGRASVATGQQDVGAGDHLWCVRPPRTPSPLGNAFVALQEADPRMVVGRR